MVTTTEVELAYRLILGREPENPEVVRAHAEKHHTLEELRWAFIASPEFEARYAREQPAMPIAPMHPLDQLAAAVETAVDAGALQRLITRIEQEFTYFGETEPHWSVLIADRFRAENIAAHEDEFFASGKWCVHDLEAAARRNGINFPNAGICFELGCGLGRTTIWLAEAFAQVIGADISPAHLALARQTVSRFGKTNVDFLHLHSPREFESLPEFDVFFSIIVLQHNPPPLIDYLLRQALRKLRLDGIAYFQIPTFSPRYRFSLEEYLTRELEPAPEMHVLPQPQLFRLIEEEGGELIEIREDGAAGPEFVSNRVLVRKKQA